MSKKQEQPPEYWWNKLKGHVRGMKTAPNVQRDLQRYIDNPEGRASHTRTNPEFLVRNIELWKRVGKETGGGVKAIEPLYKDAVVRPPWYKSIGYRAKLTMGWRFHVNALKMELPGFLDERVYVAHSPRGEKGWKVPYKGRLLGAHFSLGEKNDRLVKCVRDYLEIARRYFTTPEDGVVSKRLKEIRDQLQNPPEEIRDSEKEAERVLQGLSIVFQYTPKQLEKIHGLKKISDFLMLRLYDCWGGPGASKSAREKIIKSLASMEKEE